MLGLIKLYSHHRIN